MAWGLDGNVGFSEHNQMAANCQFEKEMIGETTRPVATAATSTP